MKDRWKLLFLISCACFASQVNGAYTTVSCSQITCESGQKLYDQCPIDGAYEVTSLHVVHRLSSSTCKEDDSYGIDSTHIWVSEGCRAIFSVCYYAACSEKSFGQNCSMNCNPNCQDGFCLDPRGVCKGGCNSGWKGDLCWEECPTGRYGPNCSRHCVNCKDNSCRNTDGTCLRGCVTGFTGEKCEEKEHCSPNCKNGVCDEGSLICTFGCSDNYFGQTCDQSCDTIQNCRHCSLSELNNLKCTSCISGWHGDNCTEVCSLTCAEIICYKDGGTCRHGCQKGWYGDFCWQPCNSKCKNLLCEWDTGVCTEGCVDYYMGPSCLQEFQCSSNCKDVVCNNETGECLNGCKDGYFGLSCSQACGIPNCRRCEQGPNGTTTCTACDKGFHGQDCSESCYLVCNNFTCDQIDGRCSFGCEPGWWGKWCSQTCDASCIDSLCHSSTGECKDVNSSSTQPRMDGQVLKNEAENDLTVIIAVVIVIIVCIIGAAVTLLVIRKKRTMSRPLLMSQLEATNITDANISNHYVEDTKIGQVYSILRSGGLLIEQENLTISNTIGAGHFGDVRKAILQTVFGQAAIDVAIKTMKANFNASHLDVFRKEVEILQKIGIHPNVVHFIGLYKIIETSSIGIVMEFCEEGDLKSYLQKMKQERGTEELDKGMHNQLIQFGIDIATGMNYLVQKQVLHRDLAARNVLLDKLLVAKVSDFGLSRNESLYVASNAKAEIPYRWMALEVLQDSIYTSASDIWSFGVVLWEMFSYGATPYPAMSTDLIFEMLKEGRRMKKPSLCRDKTYFIMELCWKENTADRPTFDDIVVTLSTLIEGTTDSEYVNGDQFVESHYVPLS